MDTNISWGSDAVAALFDQPFMDLLYQAQTIHRANFDPNKIQASALLSIKTGACPEDCAYCPQSGHHHAEISKEKLLSKEAVVTAAKQAQQAGATRFCMGAAWRNLPAKALPEIQELIGAVKALGLETCVTLGMLESSQAEALREAGLDYYNHNLDTSPEYYQEIITTRTYQDRLDTLAVVRDAGIKVCCGGIIGMGESRADRIELLIQLANQSPQPQSVPINQLIPVPGTPLEKTEPIAALEFIRTIAVARIMMPSAYVRLSAGRENMSVETQAWCFFAGANSIFHGDVLLTAANQAPNHDAMMFSELGLAFEAAVS